jgi:hypothetical protein
MREVINAFCNSDDDATVQKVVTRLCNIAALEKKLIRLLACTPTFVIQGYTIKSGLEDGSSKDTNAKKSITVSLNTVESQYLVLRILNSWVQDQFADQQKKPISRQWRIRYRVCTISIATKQEGSQKYYGL